MNAVKQSYFNVIFTVFFCENIRLYFNFYSFDAINVFEINSN